MARYLMTKEKLRKNLKLTTLVNHQWHLSSSDQNFVGVVYMYYVGYCEEFGSITGDHSNNTIHNLFSIFQKVTSCLTYIFEIGAEKKEFSLVIIPNHKTLKEVYCLHLIDHQALMVEGIDMLNAMNETNANEKTTHLLYMGIFN
jgi:hypothetical protein